MRDVIDRRRLPILVAVAILVVILISVAAVLLKEWDKNRGVFPQYGEEEHVLEYNGVDYVVDEAVETFLVIGLDKFDGATSSDSYNNDQQADFLMLLIFNNTENKYTALHINRDTIANINVLGVAGNKVGTVRKQIALSHTYGNGRDVSCHNTADAVSDLLMGAKIDHYMSLKMDSVMIFNDLVGGVEVTVLDDFTGIDNSLVKGERVTLMGKQALNYVRSRYGLDDSTNNARMERQQQYLRSLYDKTMEMAKDDEEFVVNASLEMSEYMITDRSVTQLQELARKMTEYDFVGIEKIDGNIRIGNDHVEFIPDEADVKRLVVDLFYRAKAQDK